MASIFTLRSSALPDSATVVGFRGSEALSRPYRFDVGFQLKNGEDFDLEGALGQKATLHVDRGLEPPVVWNGVIANLELLREYGSYALFVVTIVPALWQLSLTHHSHIFTEQSVPEIISSVLADSGISAFELRLAGSYRRLDHVCQYRESNLAFISRLMEREGMYYFFEQGDDGETLVITDRKSFHKPIVGKPYRYFPLPGEDVSAGGALEEFRCKLSVLPSKVKLTDYDYNKPGLDLSGEAPVLPSGSGDIVVYGENFTTPDEGKRYATVRAEELLAKKSIFHGHGQAHYLRSGYVFTLDEHPRPAFNDEYLAIEVQHHGNQAGKNADVKELLGLEYDEVYRAHLKAIPARVQFRAERATPWPRIHGVVDGIIDGASGGPYANIDAQGRYKVRIFFDESQLGAGSASTWVRMLQPHGGSPEGFHFPLRNGTEVHLIFLGGDPDRPVIVGAAHNVSKPSVVTAANNTFNVIQTGSLNRVELDDAKGAEYIRVYTPKLTSYLRMGQGPYNFISHTLGCAWLYIGSYYDVQVLGYMHEDVTGAVVVNYMDTMDITVKGAVTELFKTSLDTTVTGPVTIKYTGTLDETVNGKVTKTYQSGYEHTVNGGLTKFTWNVGHELTVNGGLTKERLNASHDVKVTGTLTHEVTGNVTETYGPKAETVKGTSDLTTTGTYTINSPAIVINSPSFTRSDGKVFATEGDKITILGQDVELKGTSFAAIGLRGELVGVDIKLVGVNVQAAVAVIDLAAFKLDNKPFKARTLGVKAEAAGPNIHITAITIYI